MHNLKQEVLRRILNLALRGITLSSKFALIIVLAKFLEQEEFGLYGLFSSTIVYFVMALGFDYHIYASREIIAIDKDKRGDIVRDQGIFYVYTYVLILPLCFLIFYFGFLPWTLILWFIILITLEHISQELVRILIAVSEPIWANFLLFIRLGFWEIIT